MGYVIRYGYDLPYMKNRTAGERNRGLILLTIGMTIFGMVLWSNWEAVRGVLLPGFDGHTEGLVEELVQELAEGAPISEAITTFCREIMNRAYLG